MNTRATKGIKYCLQRLCMNICSNRWLNHMWFLVKYFIPIGLWISNAELGKGLRDLKITFFKGCVYIFLCLHYCYIFASLFCKSKREHFWNKVKCFLFRFEFSFRSWDNQIQTFTQMSWQHQMPKHETRSTFYWITWEGNPVW